MHNNTHKRTQKQTKQQTQKQEEMKHNTHQQRKTTKHRKTTMT